MRVAVVGAGVSGCVAARLLASRHEVELFEANGFAGGHAQTVEFDTDAGRIPVDVAFMVFNRRTYPHFCGMLDGLRVASRPSDMSFSVRCDQTGFEYQGGSLRGLLARRRNAIDPGFVRMLWDIVRFNRQGTAAASRLHAIEGLSVGEFLKGCGVGRRFVRHYLSPMAAAIWSSNPREILSFPATFLLGFFANHGLLQVAKRPQWRTICGGSRVYVESLLSPLSAAGRVHLCRPVESVRRTSTGVELSFADGEQRTFDQVVCATHADVTHRLLQDRSRLEEDVLSSFPYQKNVAVLHSDSSALPRRPAARASWNYRLAGDDRAPATVTYDLARLQGLKVKTPVLLTLNPVSQVQPQAVVREFEFSHPAYTASSLAAQRRWKEVSGVRGVHFCGAYWGYGFHEDGVTSALNVASQFGIGMEACTAACTRAPSSTTAGGR